MKAKPNQRDLFKKWNLAHRFKQVPETIIHSTYLGSSSLDRNSTTRLDKGLCRMLSRKPTHPSRSIKVLSWNIAKNNYNPNWSKEFLVIMDRYQPDKIFLQEVRLRADEREIPELAKMGWTFAPNFIDTSNNTYSGVLIASQDDRIKSQAMTTKHYEPIINTPKVSLFTEYFLANNSKILAVNTHLINFVSLPKFKAQLEEIESILSIYKEAIILAGDFNAWNKSRWRLLYKMATRLNLTPVSFIAEDTKKIKSFLLSPPLDYIFHRGLKQKPNTAKVIDNISSSDHNPLFVELCLNKD